MLSQTRNPGIFYEYIVPLQKTNQILHQESIHQSGSSTRHSNIAVRDEHSPISHSFIRNTARAVGEPSATSISQKARLIFNKLNQGLAASAIATLMGKQRADNSESLVDVMSHMRNGAPESVSKTVINSDQISIALPDFEDQEGKPSISGSFGNDSVSGK